MAEKRYKRGPRPACWTKDCDKLNGRGIVACWGAGPTNSKGVKKDTAACYRHFPQEIADIERANPVTTVDGKRGQKGETGGGNSNTRSIG